MSLTVSASPIYNDIKDIISPHESKFEPLFQFEVKLHTEEKDLNYTDGVTLVDLHIIRNYVEHIGDYIEARLTIPLGTFLYDVYPFLDNIEVTLITTKQLYKGKDEPFEVKERFKAVYLLDKNTSYPNMISNTKEDLNNQMPAVITLQLLDRSVETLRVKTTSGNFDSLINKNTNMTIDAFLKSIISEEANKILIENKPALEALEIEEVDNKDKLKSVIIPSHTRVVELPKFIQEKNIGIYNGDVGIYIQNFGVDHFKYKKSLFVYSLYNNKKYDKSKYKTIFYSPISSGLSVGDITYKYKDKVLKIVAHNVTNIRDNKETAIMSTGSGFRVSNAQSYMKKPVEITEDGPVFRKQYLNTEITFKERKDGLNFATNEGIVSNQLKLASDIMKKNGNYVTIDVDNIDPDFIQPGGKCKINYEKKEKDKDEVKVEEIYGVIHSAIISFTNPRLSVPMNFGVKKVFMNSHATIHVFVNSF